MLRARTLIAMFVAVTLLVACGDDDEPTAGGTTTTSSTSTSTTSTTTSTTTTTTAPAVPAVVAVWPAADVVFTTPEEAAEDFVSKALGVPPVLGDFQQGDARSGEIEVFSPGEGGGGTSIVRSRLLLRQLGDQDGWFVIAAVNDNATITAPKAQAEVPAGTVTVEGRARGFEAAVVVEGFLPGSTEPLDQVVTQGGALETPEPYTADLDLGGTAADDVVMLLVRGGTGLDEDPGEFSAIPITITG